MSNALKSEDLQELYLFAYRQGVTSAKKKFGEMETDEFEPANQNYIYDKKLFTEEQAKHFKNGYNAGYRKICRKYGK